jgi:hypothetical protein
MAKVLSFLSWNVENLLNTMGMQAADTDEDKIDWINKISDHSLLYGEIHN